MENLPQFNLADLGFIILVLIGLARGWARGLSGELARLLSVAAGLAAGIYFYQPVGRHLVEQTRLGEWEEPATHGIAFGLIFIGTWLAMRLLRFLLRHVMEFAFRGKIEKVGGALAGLLRSAILAAAGVLLLGSCPVAGLRRFFFEESVIGGTLARHLLPVYDELREKYPALQALPRRGEPDLEDGGVEREWFRGADLPAVDAE